MCTYFGEYQHTGRGEKVRTESRMNKIEYPWHSISSFVIATCMSVILTRASTPIVWGGEHHWGSSWSNWKPSISLVSYSDIRWVHARCTCESATPHRATVTHDAMSWAWEAVTKSIIQRISTVSHVELPTYRTHRIWKIPSAVLMERMVWMTEWLCSLTCVSRCQYERNVMNGEGGAIVGDSLVLLMWGLNAGHTTRWRITGSALSDSWTGVKDTTEFIGDLLSDIVVLDCRNILSWMTDGSAPNTKKGFER